jgi:AAA+ ATPase superfamily predicted ATPase
MFKVGVPVFADDFIDRKEELKLLHFYLTECGNQSIMLHAPRRFGKTSLIQEAFRTIEVTNPYLLYFDFKYYSNLQHLANGILDRVYALFGITKFWELIKSGVLSFLRAIKPKLSIKLYRVVELSLESLEAILNETDEVSYWLKALDLLQVVAKEAGVELKVAFDEFQDIYTLTHDVRIIDRLRATLQQHSQVAYIFCGSHESMMNFIFLDKRSAFFHFARVITLGALDKNELQGYIEAKFYAIKVTLAKEDLSQILDELECHPYYSMKTMQVLYSMVLINKVKQVSAKNLASALDSAYNETKSYLEDIINYIKTKAHHFEMLISIAKKLPTTLDPLNAYRVRQSLVNMGLISSVTRGNYFITDAFLKKFLQAVD